MDKIIILLLRDLSFRLTCGVKIYCKWSIPDESEPSEDIGELIGVDFSKQEIKVKRTTLTTIFPVNKHGSYIKPYLRPMDSMTDAEKEEWNSEFSSYLMDLEEMASEDNDFAWRKFPEYMAKASSRSINWLTKNHFDYNGLIPLGIALPAPKGMYN